jgi:UDP-2-acetamido-2,6-beta-L-arabino-hexul-4-ose reductase
MGLEIVKIAVTGSRGFVGLNFCLRLRELNQDYFEIHRETSEQELHEILRKVNVVIHLAGVNRPKDSEEYLPGNAGFTEKICSFLAVDNPVPIVFASSTQAELDNPYGRSKFLAEESLKNYSISTGVPVHSIRFPNVFGKWSRPRYNSAVATFCDAIANDRFYEVHDASAPLKLLYLDDAVEYLTTCMMALIDKTQLPPLKPVYETTVGEVVHVLREFKEAGSTLCVGDVGTGLRRALYSTYISFLPTSDFLQQVKIHSDSRGDFVEMLRTPAAGQFSYFTAHPGVTRGGHYHHTKTEKFLVIGGTGKFRFRNLLTNERFEQNITGGSGVIVDSIPGWVHDVTNVGEGLLIVMLWANEVFDRSRPDTFNAEL